MTDTVVVEGQVKFRDGKKWKSRWVALRKPSPVADCLLLLAYKDKADKAKGHKERSSVTLEDICGLEPVLSYEGITYTLAILCQTQAVMLGFESRDTLLAWDARIRYSLGEVHRFSVGVLPGTKLESGPATLHLCNNLLGIARDLPPVILAQWKLSDLRRYGAVPNGFVFEGGTRCGYWAGVFFLSCVEGEQISFLFDCIVRGISPTRGPFGLRPALPDPSADPVYMEERLNQEALELEKRLSLLSHCSRQSSAASTYSYSTSAAGDDRSISSSSSEASHSDTSIGSRLTMWAEPVSSPAPVEPVSPSTVKGTLQSEEKLYAAVAGGARPPSKPPRSRRLQEIGRQSSSDSGIATGSHSSYSGSFSSYAGSIDTSQGDEFGSLVSLPLNLASDYAPCTCPPSEPPRGTGSEYQVPSSLKHLYDTPRSLFPGTPPKDQVSSYPLLASGADLKGASPLSSSAWCQELSGALGEAGTDPIPKWTAPQRQGQALDSRSGETAPSVGGSADPCEICSPQPGISSGLSAEGSRCKEGGNGQPDVATVAATRPLSNIEDSSLWDVLSRYSTGRKTLSWREDRSVPKKTNMEREDREVSGHSATEDDKKPKRKEEKCRADIAYEIMEGRGVEKASEAEERSRSLELTGGRGQQKVFGEAEDPKGSYELMVSTVDVPKRFEPAPGEYGAAFVFPAEALALAAAPDRPRGDGVTYVNIPVSPTSKKQLHYMELELQEPGSGVRGNAIHLRRHRGGSTKYAQIDITATETAHRVGTQHAQGREERLQELEQKRKGAQP
ncbi:protein Dok-7 [Megalops cyprinoides]|uniref:protein Dok-7 n=1 Tax=Megalops cyprinoides TaxID=118141 RepID=UPI00186445D2|nr:protein Dok-7 [Megalops cyprinoides]